MSCKVCHHPELKEIEQELAEGRTYTRVARRYCCTRDQVRYFAEHCMSEELKDQRFRVLKKRYEDEIARLEKQIEKNLISGVEKLPREMAEDLLETMEGVKNRTLRTS